MAYPSDLWEFCTVDCLGRCEIHDENHFIYQIRQKLQMKFHEKHLGNGQIPGFCYFGGVCEFCNDYTPSDKEVLAEACRIPTFVMHFNQVKEDFIKVNAFLNRLTRNGSGLEDYQEVIDLKLGCLDVVNLVLAKIRNTY